MTNVNGASKVAGDFTTFDVTYDDGDEEQHVHPDLIRPFWKKINQVNQAIPSFNDAG